MIMGGDDQDDPLELPRFIEKIDGGYDFVIGSRYIPGGKAIHQSLFRWLTTKLYSFFFSILARRWLTDASNGYRVFRSKLCEGLDLWKSDLDGYELEPSLLYDAVRYFKFTEVPVTKFYHQNKSYSKMRPFIDWFNIIKPVIKKFIEDVLGKKRPRPNPLLSNP